MSRRLTQASSPHQSHEGRRSDSARREKANSIEPSFGALIASPNPHFRDVYNTNSPRAAASAPQGSTRVFAGARSSLGQTSQPTEIDVPVTVVPRCPVACALTRQRSWESSFTRDGNQSPPPPAARMQRAQNVSPVRGRSPTKLPVMNPQAFDDRPDGSHLLRPQSPLVIRHDRQIGARSPPPPQVQSSHLLRPKSPIGIRREGENATRSPPGANLAKFLQAAMQNTPRNPATQLFMDSTFASLHSPPSPNVSPINYASETGPGNCREASPGLIVTQPSRSRQGESLLSAMHPLPKQGPTPPPTAVIDALTASSLLDEVRGRRGRAQRPEEDVSVVAKSNVPVSSANVLDCQEFGGAFPSVFGENFCGDVVEQSLKRDVEGNKSSDSLETVVAHSCKSEGDSLDTASTSAGQLSVPGSSKSLASVVAAAASVAKAAETLSCATDELMASVSRRRLCDLHELSPANADEELAIAHDAVAAVLATPDADPPVIADREENFMQQMTCHKSTLLKLTNVRRQCIRLEGMGVA